MNNQSAHTTHQRRLAVPLRKIESQGGYPLYIVPGIGGHILSFKLLGQHLSNNWNPYGLLHPIVGGEVHDSIEQVAERLIQEISLDQAEGPYYIAGHSMGALIALEMARLLEASGKKAVVIILDSRAVKSAPRKPFYIRLPLLLFWKIRLFLADMGSKHKRKNNGFAPYRPTEGGENTKLAKTLQEAFRVGRKQFDAYKISPCPVPAVLIRSEKRMWWDTLDCWPEDLGWSTYVDLKSIRYSAGDHLDMVKTKENVSLLAKTLESALDDVSKKLGYGSN